MSKILISGGAGSALSDECTATLADIPQGLKAVTSDSDDDIGVGTMTMTGTTVENHVLNGETFYTTDYKIKRTGTLVVNSLLSFSVAAYSGRRVLATWQNPKAALGKPYSGVYIRYSTIEYPGKNNGEQIYKGAGDNIESEGMASVYLDMSDLNTTYYFSIYPYITTSLGELTGDVIDASVTTSEQSIITIKRTSTYTIPVGFNTMDLFAVGGGGGSSKGSDSDWNGAGGAGSGYTTTVNNISIESGQQLSIVIGSGGSGYSASRGGTTSVTRSGSSLISAAGGISHYDTSSSQTSGGSNGGAGGSSSTSSGANGASNGNPGQGRTTRAFGESTGTLYAGGGGGGPGRNSGNAGAGGAGGGGAGNRYGSGGNGTANTGGGGGGSSGQYGGYSTGGSGIVLLRLK